MNMMKREPVMMAAIAAVLVSLGARYGLDVPESSVLHMLEGAATIVMALIARAQVTPNTKVDTVEVEIKATAADKTE